MKHIQRLKKEIFEFWFKYIYDRFKEKPLVGFQQEERLHLSYMVLSLKWRPQTFSELEGQKPIQQILTHAVKSDSLHPALIFAGSKGTGKTSTARILAKALRCENRITHEPCNKCPSCIAIQDGSDMDVIEIDGASNNGVDAIRHLRDSVQYLPSSGSKRIYIIDEVHMLSQSAFNALLKTLEEPPSHVTFIMATTELRKIPSTVISRCQIFNFRPIAPPIIQKRLRVICKAENIQIDDEALWLIVEQSEQSMRNAQVLLDQMACFGNKKISSHMIIDALGLSHRSLLNSVLKALIQKQSDHILSIMDDLVLVDPQIFLNNLLVQIRNVLMIKLVEHPSWLFLMESEKKLLKEMAQDISAEEIHFLFDMALKGREDLTRSFDPHITLEMILLRMSQAPQIEEILSRDIKTDKSTTSRHVPLKKDSKKDIKSHENIKETSESVSDVKRQEMVSKQWAGFIQFITKKNSHFSSQVKRFVVCNSSSQKIILGYPSSALFLKEKIKDKSFRQTLEKYAFEFFGETIKFSFILDDSLSLSANESEKKKKLLKETESHPVAQKIANLFQAQVLSVDKHTPSK